MFSLNNKNQKIAVIGCGYWGSIIINTLLKLKFKKIIIFDKIIKNKKIVKKRFKIIEFEDKFHKILNNENIKNIFVATLCLKI